MTLAADTPAHKPAKVLAMVLSREPVMPDANVLERELQRTRAAHIDHAGATMMAVDVEGEPSMVGLIPAPVPWSQLEGPCATAWWWPETTETCRASTAHYLVTTQAADGDVLAANLRLTAIVAAIVRATQAPAVYWGAGTVVRSGEDFVEQAASATRALLPLGLWVDFRVVPLPDGDLFFATTGMKALGHMELESIAPRAAADHVLGRLFNAAHYLCDHGPVLLDGQTFGLSAAEKIEISHRPSRWKRPGDVVFLEMPSGLRAG